MLRPPFRKEFLMNPGRFGGGGGGGADPNFSNVALLLAFDDATLWIDDSPTPKTLTPNGTISLSATQKKFGARSASCGGGRLTAPTHADFGMAADFTLDMWFYLTSSSGLQTLFNIGSYLSGMMLRINGNTQINTYINNTSNTQAYAFTLNTWYQITVLRKAAGVVEIWVNKVLVGGFTVASAMPAGQVMIAQSAHNGGEFITGYVDEIRLTKNVARNPLTYDITVAWPRS